jgi:hypothetical protein
MLFLCFSGIIVVGLIVFAEHHSEHTSSLPFPNEADYFSRLRQTEHELNEVQERAMTCFGCRRW